MADDLAHAIVSAACNMQNNDGRLKKYIAIYCCIKTVIASCDTIHTCARTVKGGTQCGSTKTCRKIYKAIQGGIYFELIGHDMVTTKKDNFTDIFSYAKNELHFQQVEFEVDKLCRKLIGSPTKSLLMILSKFDPAHDVLSSKRDADTAETIDVNAIVSLARAMNQNEPLAEVAAIVLAEHNRFQILQSSNDSDFFSFHFYEATDKLNELGYRCLERNLEIFFSKLELGGKKVLHVFSRTK